MTTSARVQADGAFEAWVVEANKAWLSHPLWRRGQAFFEHLCITHPGLAEGISGSRLDPYYDDAAIPVFLDWLEAKFREAA